MGKRILAARGLGAAAMLLASACGGGAGDADGADSGEAAIQRGIDLAVADVLAAEKAASTPLPEPEEAPAAE
jgi:hypothetical protein